jgi:hypothetical protein
MDYGYPQFTEAPILQEFIKTDSYRMEVRQQQACTSIASASSGSRLAVTALSIMAGCCNAGYAAWRGSSALHGNSCAAQAASEGCCWFGPKDDEAPICKSGMPAAAVAGVAEAV